MAADEGDFSGDWPGGGVGFVSFVLGNGESEGLGGTYQSPFMAWRSVWQTPEYFTLMRTSSGPGEGTGIFL